MEQDTIKLFRITLKGFNGFNADKYKTVYVIAKDINEAYFKVRTFLDEKDLGDIGDRTLEKIELIAEDSQYTHTNHILFL